MDSITIRKAKKDNADDILSFVNSLAKHVGELDNVTATKELLESTIFADNSHVEVLLAYLNEKPVGYILYYKTFSTFKSSYGLFIEDLFVCPEYRNKGVGTKLFQQVESIAKKSDMCKVEWYVNNMNQSAIDFYQKFNVSVLNYKSIYYVNFKKHE